MDMEGVEHSGDGSSSIVIPPVISCVTLKTLTDKCLLFHHLKEGYNGIYLIGWLEDSNEIMQLKCLTFC